jgi:hypothetical protein
MTGIVDSTLDAARRLLAWLPFPGFLRRWLAAARVRLLRAHSFAPYIVAVLIALLVAATVVHVGTSIAQSLWKVWGWLSRNSVDALSAYDWVLRVVIFVVSAKLVYEFLTAKEPS